MINPVYWLDLRVRVREKKLWILVVAFVLILGLVSALSLATIGFERIHSKPADIGTALAMSAIFLQAGLLLLLAPLGAAGRISQEREQRTIASLVNSTLGSKKIVFGKLLGCWSFVLWIGLLPVPFALVGSLWGGPEISTVLFCLFSNLLAGLTLASIAIGLSGFFGRSLTAYLVVGAVLFVWLAVIPLIGIFCMSFVGKGAGQSFFAYIFFYHHPVLPLIAAIDPAESFYGGSRLFMQLYCFGVWGLLSFLSYRLAVRGVEKEIY